MKKTTLLVVGVAIVGSGYFFQRAWFGQRGGTGASASEFFQEQARAFARGQEARKDFKVAPGVSPASLFSGAGASGSSSLPGFAGAAAIGGEEEVPASVVDAQVLAELRKPLSSVEVESVADLLSTLANHVHDGTTPAELVKQLERSGLKPVAAVDENADTGKMVMVRTEDALPGTRYFHAQFFEDENGRMQAQHISFEVRPGPDSEEVARKLIQQTFVGAGEPTTRLEGFSEWKMKGCKTISMKKQSKQDLQDSFFNAYSLETDVGTIRVSQEDDPHCHESAAEHQ